MNKIFFYLLIGTLSLISCTKKMAPTTATTDSKASMPSAPAAAVVKSDAQAVTVLKGYIDAIGGKDKLSNVKSMMMKMAASTSMGDLNITQYMKDGMSAMKTEMGGTVVMEQKFDGTTLQVSGMGGTQNITDAAAIKGAKKQAKMFDELDQLISNDNLKKYIGMEDLDGKKVHKLVITDEDKNETTQYFDASNNLLVRTISSMDAMGQKLTQTMDFSDYKDVNGVKFPHSVKMTGGSVPFPLDMKVVALMVNSDLPDQLFKIK